METELSDMLTSMRDRGKNRTKWRQNHVNHPDLRIEIRGFGKSAVGQPLEPR